MTMNKIMGVLLAGLLSFSLSASPTGKWSETPGGMPYFEFSDAPAGEGEGDPYAFLGNSRLNLFAHASGVYQFISGERVWARFNADPERENYGKNRAMLIVEGDTTEFVGMKSIASDPEKTDFFAGIGFARHDYRLADGLKCTRMISVMPSGESGDASPAFLLSFIIRNTSSQAKRFSYDEIVLPNFVPMDSQHLPAEERAFRYPYQTLVTFRTVEAKFGPIPQVFVPSYTPETPFAHEVAPKPLFVYSPDAFLCIYHGEIHAKIDSRVKAGEEKRFDMVIGLADENFKKNAEMMIARVEKGTYGAYASQWKAKLPDFSKEKDKAIRARLYSDAHMLEASSVYDGYFGETFIPQGGTKTYGEGLNEGNMSHIHAALSMCHSNPKLAKSIIRYVMMHSDLLGRIQDGNYGYGCTFLAPQDGGRVQLALFNAIAEYLRLTGDYSFIEERILIYPVDSRQNMSVLQLLERYFVHLRDYALKGADADMTRQTAAMASVVLPEFTAQLKASGKVDKDFTKALEAYAAKAEETFLSDPGDVASSSSVYLLQMPSVPASTKRTVFDFINENSIGNGEAGYPFVLGVATFDRIEAMKLYRKKVLEETSYSYWHNSETYAPAWTTYLYMKLFE